MFEGESGTRPGVDLNAITERMHIRKAVQSGNIEAAIEAANDLDPQVCEAAPSSNFNSALSYASADPLGCVQGT